MSGDHKNLVTNDSCTDRTNAMTDKIIDLKANIHTSKESLGNRLDKVDSELQKALLGDVGSPGGLCGEVSDLKRDVEEATNNWKEHRKIVDDNVKSQNFRMKLCIILVALLLGGRILGYSISAVVNYMKPTPITAPAPIEEEDYEIPAKIKDFIREELSKNTPKENIETVSSIYIETDIIVPEDMNNVN